MTGYPKDRSYQDQMENELDELHNAGGEDDDDGIGKEETRRAGAKRRKRGGKKTKTDSGRHWPSKFEKDRGNGGRGEREDEGGMSGLV